ncbi:dipeptidase PepV [Bacillus sp. AFS002410]|uniref:dipeptidase PepV n=1 Tax=Bacillus sp. AFS002410 TaxID=2033481 RepID=UPI000BEF8565|nr:dipeptidase PepV [Bacillus sp. AFS002410]PEJ57536.1 dipeptidase PepV [Bacillus sp. AFS002410]
MTQINWMEEVLKRKEDYLKQTIELLNIESVYDESTISKEAPMGKGINEALTYMLNLGEKDGFIPKNVDGFAGHLEMGSGEELVGILCHLDVVPAGDGWSHDPFDAIIKDGNIYARGAIDDKGPTMAAYYAMKIVKELGLPINKRVRMILGTDEESQWRCVDHYFENEEMPTMGFAPDADFPIIYAEKGILDINFNQVQLSEDNESEYKLVSFSSGRRVNMVPDHAKAIVSGPSFDQEAFTKHISELGCKAQISEENGNQVLVVEGVSVHGMEPDKGKNAGIALASFLNQFGFNVNADRFLNFIVENFKGDSRGKNMGVAFNDDITGDLTINLGIMQYEENKGGTFGLTLRYPVTTNIDFVISTLTERGNKFSFEYNEIKNSTPHHVPKDHPLIQTLQKVYEEQTGEEATLLTIGGGTYARSLSAGVAFGPLFLGKPEVAHQKDEYAEIDDLLKAIAIYAQAIAELVK